MYEEQGCLFQLFGGKVWVELCRWGVCVCVCALCVRHVVCFLCYLYSVLRVCACVSERFHSHSHLLPSTYSVKLEASSGFIQTDLGLSGDLRGGHGQCFLSSQGKARPQQSMMMKAVGNRWVSRGMLEGVLEEKEGASCPGDFLTALRGHCPLATGPP